MPKVGQEPLRRAALMQAAVAEIGEAGTLDVTVRQIAQRAGMSSALAHHYFGGKAQIFLAAMRHVLTQYGAETRTALAAAPQSQRLEALIAASFSESCFQPATVAAWLNFYVLAQRDPQAARLLRIYHGRLRSNLVCALRGRCTAPEQVAERVGALIDGFYIRTALSGADITAADVIAATHTMMETT